MLGTWMTIIAVGGQQLLTSGNSASASKKNTSRRNAWGNLSYADLITQAITSANETRLTLSQIYEWMVQNVPYFKDKGDSNSSAGWKVRGSCLDFNIFGLTFRDEVPNHGNLTFVSQYLFIELLLFIK